MGRGGPCPGPDIIIAGGMGSPAMLALGICIPAFRQEFASQIAQYRSNMFHNCQQPLVEAEPSVAGAVLLTGCARDS